MTTKTAPIIVAESGSPEWYAARHRGLGASELAAAAGLSNWETPLSLYHRKRGELPPIEETDDMRLGKKFEPIIVSEFAHRTGLAVRQYPCPMHAHPDHAWLFATPDADLENGELLEAKKTGFRMAAHWGEEGTDQAPAEYVVQAQGQMEVMGRDRVHIAALVDGSRLKIYPVERNDELIGMLLAAAGELWERIVNGDAPEPTWGHRSTLELLKELHNSVDGEDIHEAPEDIREAWLEREHCGRLGKVLEKRGDELKARCLHALGDRYAFDLGDGRIVRRKEIAATSYVVEKKAYVDFRTVNHPGVKGNGAKTQAAVIDRESRLVEIGIKLATAGYMLRDTSYHGSQYWVALGRSDIRVADHAPNEATANYLDVAGGHDVRIDSADWESQLVKALA